MNLTRKEYATDQEKKKDFRLGFIGWYVGNILLCLLQYGIGILLVGVGSTFDPNSGGMDSLVGGLGLILTLIPWVLNLGLLIYFAMTRSQIALGMAAAFASAILLAILAGVVLTVACFVSLGSYQ